MFYGTKDLKSFSLSSARCAAFTNSRCVREYGGSSLLRNRPNKKQIEKEKKIAESLSEEDVKMSCMEVSDDSENNTIKRNTDEDTSNMRALSKRSKSKLFNRCAAFISAQGKHRFPFLTLTFIGRVDDKQGIKVLNKFLTVIRREVKNFNYLWVAERQLETTQNIHFHLVLDKFIEIKKFNALWVLQQYNSGIEHPNYSYSEIVERYRKNTISEVLNPADVRWATGANGVSMYLTKYVSKNESKLDCALWHCSRDVSKICVSTKVDERVFREAGNGELNSSINKNTGEIYEPFTIEQEYCVIRTILDKTYFSKYLNDLVKVNQWILKGRPNKLPDVRFKEFLSLYLIEKQPIDKDKIDYDFIASLPCNEGIYNKSQSQLNFN